jgi:hypothetical protein
MSSNNLTKKKSSHTLNPRSRNTKHRNSRNPRNPRNNNVKSEVYLDKVIRKLREKFQRKGPLVMVIGAGNINSHGNSEDLTRFKNYADVVIDNFCEYINPREEDLLGICLPTGDSEFKFWTYLSEQMPGMFETIKYDISTLKVVDNAEKFMKPFLDLLILGGSLFIPDMCVNIVSKEHSEYYAKLEQEINNSHNDAEIKSIRQSSLKEFLNKCPLIPALNQLIMDLTKYNLINKEFLFIKITDVYPIPKFSDHLLKKDSWRRNLLEKRLYLKIIKLPL